MFSLRSLLPHGVVALLACAFIPSFAVAQGTPPMREIWRAGAMSVTAIQDLPGDMALALFKGPAPEQEKARYFSGGKAEAGINVFLLRAGGRVGLVDAGAGTAFQTPGRLPEALASLGVKPQDIDFVLLTHLHGDHLGGLLRGDERAFPKARLYIARPELDAWLALADQDPANLNAAKVRRLAAVYGADMAPPFAFGDAPLPGVTALDAAGHTPGHTVFQLTAGGKSLLLVGDLIHSMPLQFALPDECAAYDMNPSQAVAARQRIFALAAQSGTPIAGVHFPFGNIVGAVERDGEGWKFKALP